MNETTRSIASIRILVLTIGLCSCVAVDARAQPAPPQPMTFARIRAYCDTAEVDQLVVALALDRDYRDTWIAPTSVAEGKRRFLRILPGRLRMPGAAFYDSLINTPGDSHNAAAAFCGDVVNQEVHP